MKRIALSVRWNFTLSCCLLAVFACAGLQAQTVIGGTTPHPTAELDVQSSERGFLPPRLTEAERDAINTPATGLTIYNIDARCIEFFNGLAWRNLCDGTVSEDALQNLQVLQNTIVYTEGQNGFVDEGNLDPGDNYGQTANIGDIDGNGVSDLAVGAFEDESTGGCKGVVYIHLLEDNAQVISTNRIGKGIGLASGVDLNELACNDEFGVSVAGLGDLDSDGTMEIAVGAWLGENDGSDSGSGTVYVLSLNASGVVTKKVLIQDNLGGESFGDFDVNLEIADRFGQAVANIGDIDGDGVIDLAVIADGDGDGVMYIFPLNTDGTVKNGTEGGFITKITDNANGFSGNFNTSGFGLTGLGDVDDDGVNDLAFIANNNTIYVLFLNADGTVKDQQEIAPGVGGFDGSELGGDQIIALTSVGDLNGDGINDLAVGASNDENESGMNNNTGAVYLLTLDSSGMVTDEVKIAPGLFGFTEMLNSGDKFGRFLGNPGDVDGNGINDLYVGAEGSNKAYLIFLGGM